MTSKTEIINNLREYTSDQIVEAINAGVVTMYELSKSGNLTPLMRRKIEEKLAHKRTEDIESPSMETSQPTHKIIQETTKEKSLNPTSDSEAEKEVIIPEAPILTETVLPTFEDTNSDLSNTSQGYEVSNVGMFKHPFSFYGRIRRLEYGISFIISYICCFIWNIFVNVAILTPDKAWQWAIILIITYILIAWFMLAQSCKRCHDRGNSGWYQLIPFYFLVLLFGKGEEGENDYGNNPKK